MFEGWDNFYLMIGSAAGALIGLLFVVATLTGGIGRETAMRGSTIYLTPTVFHFAVVLVISALAAVPHLSARTAGVGVGAVAILGEIYALRVVIMLRRPNMPEPAHWSDFWAYGCGPGLLYLALLGAAVAVGAGVASALNALGATLIAVMLLAIRNAWDLVTYLASARTPDA